MKNEPKGLEQDFPMAIFSYLHEELTCTKIPRLEIFKAIRPTSRSVTGSGYYQPKKVLARSDTDLQHRNSQQSLIRRNIKYPSKEVSTKQCCGTVIFFTVPVLTSYGTGSGSDYCSGKNLALLHIKLIYKEKFEKFHQIYSKM
jgi:hypothetical protein